MLIQVEMAWTLFQWLGSINIFPVNFSHGDFKKGLCLKHYNSLSHERAAKQASRKTSQTMPQNKQMTGILNLCVAETLMVHTGYSTGNH